MVRKAGDWSVYLSALIGTLPNTHSNPHTGGLAPTSPSTNEELDPAQVQLFPNKTLRTLVIEYREAKRQEWAEAVRRWEEWEAAAHAGGEQ